MKPRRRADRSTAITPPAVLATVHSKRSPWYESPAEIEEGLRRGREKRRQLKRVKDAMGWCLTAIERRCTELYYFDGLSYREAAGITGTSPSSVYRAVVRSVRKLRATLVTKTQPRRRPANGPTITRPRRARPPRDEARG